jgi:hypothetical protein
VAEGPSAAVLNDHGGRPTTVRRWITYPVNWLVYALQSFMSGAEPPAGVLAVIDKIAPRPLLLISAGEGKEQSFARLLFEAASEPKELWEVPEAPHGGCYFARPEAYSERVAGFFDQAMLKSGQASGLIMRRQRYD